MGSETSIMLDKEDLQEAVSTISKLSAGRILPFFEHEDHGELQKITIPVRDFNQSDTNDTAMRRYMQDWIHRKLERVGVDHRFEKLPMGTSYYSDKEYPVKGSIVITWWPKKKMGDYEEWRKRREEGRKI